MKRFRGKQYGFLVRYRKFFLIFSGIAAQFFYILPFIFITWFIANSSFSDPISFSLWLFFPIMIILLTSMWVPYFINNKLIIFITVFFSGILVATVEYFIIPVKYYFPNALFFPVTYAMFSFLGLKILSPIGIRQRQLVDESLKKVISVKESLIFLLRFEILRIIGGLVIFTTFVIIIVVSVPNPSVFGAGILEFEATFPSKLEFDNAISNNFFSEDLNSLDFHAMEYERKPLGTYIATSIPFSYVQDFGQYYGPYKSYNQIILSSNVSIDGSAEGLKPFQLPYNLIEISFTVNNIPSSKIGFDCKKTDSIYICSKSETYFLMQYPGYKTPGVLESISFIKKSFETDKNERILYKTCNNASILLLARVSDKLTEETLTKLINIIKC